jgi:hypothetical protein
MILPPRTLLSVMTYEIDRENFRTIDGFYNELSRVLIPGATSGRNLDDGFGTPDKGSVLVWKKHDLSRESLGTGLRRVSPRSSARFASLWPYARRMRARRAFASARLPALGTEPNCTVRRSARPANRTFHETTRLAAGTEGRWSVRTDGQPDEYALGMKSPTVTRMPSLGTVGVPSRCFAPQSAGKRKLPTRIHATGPPRWKPGLTDPVPP